jgi:hypothetical protein
VESRGDREGNEEDDMRRNLAIATGVAAGVTAVALIASPALAKAGPWSEAGNGSNATCLAAGGTGASGAGFGPGLGNGDTNGLGRRNVTPGAMGLGMPSNLATGTLTSAQKTSLAGMADEEKLAHDLYSVLAAKYPGVVQFDRIAQSETMHLTAVRNLLTRYGIPDPTAGLQNGTFSSAKIQSLYNDLPANATNDSSALAVGVTVEKADIAGLKAALSGVTAPDVTQVLTHLCIASEHHLAAFGG